MSPNASFLWSFSTSLIPSDEEEEERAARVIAFPEPVAPPPPEPRTLFFELRSFMDGRFTHIYYPYLEFSVNQGILAELETFFLIRSMRINGHYWQLFWAERLEAADVMEQMTRYAEEGDECFRMEEYVDYLILEKFLDYYENRTDYENSESIRITEQAFLGWATRVPARRRFHRLNHLGADPEESPDEDNEIVVDDSW